MAAAPNVPHVERSGITAAQNPNQPKPTILDNAPSANLATALANSAAQVSATQNVK